MKALHMLFIKDSFFTVSQSQPERVCLRMNEDPQHKASNSDNTKHQSHLGKGQVLVEEGSRRLEGNVTAQ